MANGFKAVAIIPARGGSKGLPRKNVLELNGKPLLAYSIETALRSRLVDNVIVSTEDDEIAEVALAAGAEVPFKRSENLAIDTAPPGWAVDWTLERLREVGRTWDGVITLYPTHPFRKPAMLDWVVSSMRKGHCVIAAAKKLMHDHFSLCRQAADGSLFPLLEKGGGSLYFRPFGTLQAQFNGGSAHTTLLPLTDPIELIDIDTQIDFDLAQEVVRRELYDFDGPFTPPTEA